MIQEHVAVVRGQNSKEINEFVQKIPVRMGTTLDLSGAGLRDLKLTNVDFQNTKLNGTDFSGSTFDSVNFMRAKMEGAYFRNCRFINCIMGLMDAKDAEFIEATITGCKMMRADLTDAIFYKAILRNSYLMEVIVSGLTNFESLILENVKLVQVKFPGTNFKGSRLNDCNLYGVELVAARMAGVQCTNCIFDKAKFLGKTTLKEAFFRDCRMQGTEFRGVDGRSSDFSSSYMKDARLINCDFYGANFSGCDLRDADLSGSKFDNARFSNAVMKRIKLDGQTSVKELVLNGCQLSVHDNVPTKVAITVLSNGIVHNASFVHPVFGRKVRDQAWLNDWKRDIDNKEPLEYGGWLRFLNTMPVMSRRPLSYFGMKILQFLWWVLSDYGRSIWRWAGWSVFFSFLFSVLFFCMGEEHFSIDPAIISGWAGGWFKYAYYSVVTFTTLGFGDITPKTTLGMAYVMFEVVIGYVMLGGLISILANKLARRND